jgi:flagellum-specific ATP synthase
LQVLEWVSLYQASRTLIDAGLYAKGANAPLDRAIERRPEIVRFLKQGRSDVSSLPDTISALARLAEGVAHAP